MTENPHSTRGNQFIGNKTIKTVDSDSGGLTAQKLSLRDRLGEALVRENNLRAALEEILGTAGIASNRGHTQCLTIARKVLANEQDK